MSTIGAGKEVLSYCNKCKLTLAHIIINMKNDNAIGKVQCKTCNANHAYKDPSKVKARGKKKTSKSKKTDSISDLWMTAVNNTKAKSQDYSIKTQFSIGDIIDHSVFGPGVVERAIDADKIEVIFRHDIKILIHNKES